MSRPIDTFVGPLSNEHWPDLEATLAADAADERRCGLWAVAYEEDKGEGIATEGLILSPPPAAWHPQSCRA